MLKRHCVELLPHDVIELILERLSLKTLVRFKCVSKTWKTTIDSRTFQKQQLIRRRRKQSGDDVLFVCILDYSDYEAGRMRLMFGSQVICTVMLPFPIIEVCHGSCDGLLCLADFFTPNFVINPVTGWHQSFPYSGFQQLVITEWCSKGNYSFSVPKIGFGKDKLRGTYKPVWLYNSSEFGLDNVTTCEVFDFGINAWRYVLPASPYRISGYHFPLYLDGSLYWFTECDKVLSFCLETETFQIISETPFTHLLRKPSDFIMSVLDNRLCVSKYTWPYQVIWLLLLDDSSSLGGGTWEKFCCIDVGVTFDWFGSLHKALEPVAILDKNKLLLHGFGYMIPVGALVIYDLHTKSLSLLYRPTTLGQCVGYFPSLLTALPN